MKRKLFLAALLSSVVLLMSCNKDDMELLKHPYRVQGELTPSFGLPVISSGQLNLNDLLTSFDGTFSGLITADNTITFHYDTSIRDSIIIGEMITKGVPSGQRSVASSRKPMVKHGRKEYTAPFISRDTVFEYSIPIDFFDKTDMQSIVNAGLSINELRLNLGAYVRGECPANVDSVLRAYVTARFDNVTIRYMDHDYQVHTFTGFADQSLVLHDIINGGTVNFDSVNLASIFNSMPRMITAGVHMHVEVDSGLLIDNWHNILTDTNGINSFSALLDSLRLTKLLFGGDLDVKLPFEVRIEGLPYSYDLELKGNGSEESASVFDQLDTMLTNLLGDGAVSLDSSKVSAIFKFSNGIPLDLTLSGTLVDANGMETYVLFDSKKIASAVTGPVPGRPGVVQAVRDSTSLVEIPLTVEGLERLTQASKLRLRLLLATADFASDPSYRSVKRDDYLRIKMMVKLDPSIRIDMELFDGFGDMIGNLPVIGGFINN